MNKPSQISLNFFVFFLLLLLSAVLQSSLFHWIWAGHATLQLAICVITYVCLYRKPLEAFIFTLLASYCLGLCSSMLQSVAVFGGVCLFIFNQGVRSQIYNSGPVHFSWTALSNILVFHVSTWLVSSIFESSAPLLRPLDWCLEILFTALVVRSLYGFFIKVDQKTKRLEVGELEK